MNICMPSREAKFGKLKLIDGQFLGQLPSDIADVTGVPFSWNTSGSNEWHRDMSKMKEK